MTRRLRYSYQARLSLDDIANSIFDSGGDIVAARRLTDCIRSKCRSLAELPGTLGRARADLRPDLRSFAVGNYLIFFRYVGDEFEVVDVLDGRRDIDGYFSDN